jgi:hypothetical protein
MRPDALNTTQAAEEINRLAADAGSPRRVRPATVRDWRTDGKGPRYRKVSRWFVEYDPEDLRDWTREVYLGLPAETDASRVAV